MGTVTERSPRWLVTHLTSPSHKTDTMEANLSATFDAGSSFNTKLRDTLQGLLSANNERKSEIDALRGDHDTLKKDHDALVNTTERENDLRKNEIKDPGLRDRWTLWPPSAWACRDPWRSSSAGSESMRRPCISSNPTSRSSRESTSRSRRALSLRTATPSTPWRPSESDGSSWSPPSTGQSTEWRTRS